MRIIKPEDVELIKKEFHNFIDMRDAVNHILGYDQKRAGRHFYPDEKDPPYLNFWHWQIKECLPDNFTNDSYTSVFVDLDYFEGKIEPWQMEIQKVWNDTFGHIADEDGYIDIWMSW